MTYLFSASLVQALGGALAHSIWQGAAAAALLALLLPRIRTASGRYWAAYCTLTGMFVAAAITFGFLLEPEHGLDMAQQALSPEVAGGGIGQSLGIFASLSSEMVPAEGQSLHWWDNFENYYPFMAAGWLVGFTFFLLKLADGLFKIRQLRRRWVTPASADWQGRATVLTAQLGMRRPVVLLESALATVPLAMGYFRPIVLFPFGLINQLTPEEVEAVLAHELAHIARRDWVLNLLQSFMETVFYYHPAAWWLSYLIRTEREQSCDDVAVMLTGNRLAYAKALLHLAEMPRKATPDLALSARGWSNSRPLLLERVRRILQTSQPVSFTMEKIFATIALLALCVFCGLRANKNNPIVQSALAQISQPLDLFTDNDADLMPADSIPKKKGRQTITRDDGNQRVHLELKDGEITQMNIDGKEIPAAEFGQYRALTDELRRDIATPPLPPDVPETPEAPEAPEIPDAPEIPEAFLAPIPPMPPVRSRIITGHDKDGNTTLRIERRGNPVELIVKDGNVWKDGRKLEDGETLELMGMDEDGYFFMNGDDDDHIEIHGRASAPGRASGSGSSWSSSNREWQEDVREAMAEARSHLDNLRQEKGKLMRNLREKTKDDRLKIQEELRGLQREIEIVQKEFAQNFKNRARSSEDGMREETDFDAIVQSALQRDGLITDTKEYSFSLSNKKLEVNGKKQSDELRKKYLELYHSTTGKPLSEGGSVSYEVKR